MVSHWERLGKSPTLQFLGTLSSIGAFLWAIIIAAGAFVGLLLVPQWVGPILGGVTGAGFTTWVVWLLIERNRTKKAKMNDWNPWLRIRVRNTHVFVESSKKITYRITLEVEVLQDDVDRLNWRVGWTGHGAIATKVFTAGFRHELRPSPVDNARMLCVRFDRPRRKGDRLTIEFEIDTDGSVDEQQPFYSMTLYDSQIPKAANITVEFGVSVPVKSVQKELYATDTAAWPMQPPETVPLGRSRTISWDLQCRRGWRYCVRWEYDRI